MAFKSKGKNFLWVGARTVENGACLWKAPVLPGTEDEETLEGAGLPCGV